LLAFQQMKEKLKIIPVDLLEQYNLQVDKELKLSFDKLEDAELSTLNFSFYTSVASVFSSKIEGEEIELDSYIKHKRFGIEFLPDYTKKIDDLYEAYSFAKNNVLNKENVAEVHKILSRHIVGIHQQGKLRIHNMYVSTPDGKIEYVAATPFELAGEMDKLYNDIDILLQEDLNTHEVFFFAALIHLVFIKIHPWNDGNGRSARLIEKWFLAQKLGEKAWFVQSEKNYYQQHQLYYQNIRSLGFEYVELNYSKALPFLLMLPDSVCIK
jgi:Fic family protein